MDMQYTERIKATGFQMERGRCNKRRKEDEIEEKRLCINRLGRDRENRAGEFSKQPHRVFKRTVKRRNNKKECSFARASTD